MRYCPYALFLYNPVQGWTLDRVFTALFRAYQFMPSDIKPPTGRCWALYRWSALDGAGFLSGVMRTKGRTRNAEWEELPAANSLAALARNGWQGCNVPREED